MFICAHMAPPPPLLCLMLSSTASTRAQAPTATNPQIWPSIHLHSVLYIRMKFPAYVQLRTWSQALTMQMYEEQVSSSDDDWTASNNLSLVRSLCFLCVRNQHCGSFNLGLNTTQLHQPDPIVIENFKRTLSTSNVCYSSSVSHKNLET
jgi:hypothetical protein